MSEPKKEILLPKGFKFTKSNKEIIVIAAAKSKYQAEAEEIALEEFQLVNDIYEFFYPKEKRDFLVRAANVLTRKENDINAVCEWKENFTLYINSARLGTAFSNKEWETVANVMHRHSTITIGIDRRWGYPHDNSQLLEEFGSKLIDFGEMRIMDMCGGYQPNSSSYRVDDALLSDSLKRCFGRLYVKAKNFRIKLRTFQLAVEQVLAVYASPVKLVEVHPEFGPWIWQAKRMIDGAVEPCSDIPVADLMQDVRKMLAA